MKLFSKQQVGKALFISILTSGFLYQAHRIIDKFFSEQTFMVSSFFSQTDTTFPEITYCAKAKHKVTPFRRLPKSSSNISLFIKNAPAFWKAHNISHQNWKAQITSKEMFEEVTLSTVPQIIDGLYVRFFEASQETGKHYWRFNKGMHDEVESFFKIRSHPSFGQCATFMISDDIKSYGYYYSWATS